MSGDEGGGGSGAASGTLAPTVTVAVPGLHGTVSPFDGSKDDWVEYTERLESYFVANDITDVAKRRAIPLNAVGPTTYCLIKTVPTWKTEGPHLRVTGGEGENPL